MPLVKLGTLHPYTMFTLGAVPCLVLPTPTNKVALLKIVNILELVGDDGSERELSSSVEVEVSANKREMFLACSRIYKDAIHAL